MLYLLSKYIDTNNNYLSNNANFKTYVYLHYH